MHPKYTYPFIYLAHAEVLNCAYVFDYESQEDAKWIPLPDSMKEVIYEE